jgi:hypothetical protein
MEAGTCQNGIDLIGEIRPTLRIDHLEHQRQFRSAYRHEMRHSRLWELGFRQPRQRVVRSAGNLLHPRLCCGDTVAHAASRRPCTARWFSIASRITSLTRTRCCSASIFNSASIAGLIRNEVVILPSSAFALAGGGGAGSGAGDVFLASTVSSVGFFMVQLLFHHAPQRVHLLGGLAVRLGLARRQSG